MPKKTSKRTQISSYLYIIFNGKKKSLHINTSEPNEMREALMTLWWGETSLHVLVYPSLSRWTWKISINIINDIPFSHPLKLLKCNHHICVCRCTSWDNQGPALSPVSPDTGASTLPCQLGYHVLKYPSWRRLVYKLKWAPRWTQSKTEVFWEVKVKSVTLTTSPSQIWSWHHKPKRQCGRRDSEKLSQSELVWPALGSCQEVTRWQRRPGWSTCCIWDVPQH